MKQNDTRFKSEQEISKQPEFLEAQNYIGTMLPLRDQRLVKKERKDTSESYWPTIQVATNNNELTFFLIEELA